MSTNLDEYVELKMDQMAALPPLGGVTRTVYMSAGSPNDPADILDEAGDQLSAYIADELKGKSISLDARTLSVLTKIVATAMIEQHEFTQTITNITCLSDPEDVSKTILETWARRAPRAPNGRK